ncbi:hypothetical protein [Staphylococcus shinii]|uniref:hypothetical protein n=1 Tax=Staphylococcus shinii TaxID=2912228 RepID=UPI003EE82CE0
MGTSTAIFQEQMNGRYVGTYIHNDGYIEGVGQTLFEHYSDRQKTAELLNKKRFLSSLGTTTGLISHETQLQMYKSESEELGKYCVSGEDEEYFFAANLAEIRNMQYLSYYNGEIDGYYVDTRQGKEFKAFRGSDNNGFLYVQDLQGIWYVSLVEDKSPYNMKSFEELSKYL